MDAFKRIIFLKYKTYFLGVIFLIFLFCKGDSTRVLSVVDGDTLKILYKGREEYVRLIGIDTPESRVNDKAKRDALQREKDLRTIIKQGKQATKYVKGLVEKGDPIRIKLGVQPRDQYGRLLGYVYLPNGKMLNEEIIHSGYAYPLTIPPNVKYQERFLKAYREARQRERGLWRKE